MFENIYPYKDANSTATPEGQSTETLASSLLYIDVKAADWRTDCKSTHKTEQLMLSAGQPSAESDLARIAASKGMDENEQQILNNVFGHFLKGAHTRTPSDFNAHLRRAADRLYSFNADSFNRVIAALVQSENPQLRSFANRLENEPGDMEMRGFGRLIGLEAEQVRALYQVGLRYENLHAYRATNAWVPLVRDAQLVFNDLSQDQQKKLIKLLQTSRNEDRRTGLPFLFNYRIR